MRLSSANLPTLLCVLLLCFSVAPYSARAAETLWRHSVHTEPVASVAVSPDGSYIASCDSAGTMVLSETETGAPVTTLTNDSLQCRCVCFSASGKLFALWSSRSNAESSFAACVVKEYTVPGMQESRQWRTERGGGGAAYKYDFVNAQIAVTGESIFWLFTYQLIDRSSSDESFTMQIVVRLNETNGKADEYAFNDPDYCISSLAPTPDGQRVLLATPKLGQVQVVDSSRMSILNAPFFETTSDIIRIAPGGMFVAGRDIAITLNQFLHKKIDIGNAPTFEFSPDGTVLLVPSGNSFSAPALYSVAQARWLYRYGSSNGVRQNALAVCPDNRTFITGADDGSLTRWLLPESVRTLPLAVDFTVRDSNVYAGRLVQFDPLLPVIADTFSLRWSFGDGGKSTSFAPTHRYVRTGRYTVTMEVITPEGEVLSSATRTSYINVQHLDSGVRWVQGSDNNSGVRFLAVSQDSSRAAVLLNNDSVMVLDATTGDVVYRSYINQERGALALSLSPDGTIVYTVETDRDFIDGTIRRADTCQWFLYERNTTNNRDDSTLITRYVTYYDEGYTHSSFPRACIGVAPGGNTVVINIGDHSVYSIYDAYTSGALYVWERSTKRLKLASDIKGQIFSFDFSRDGTRLLFTEYWSNYGGHADYAYHWAEPYSTLYSIPGDSIEYRFAVSPAIDAPSCARFSPDNVYLATNDTLYNYSPVHTLDRLFLYRVRNFEWASTGTHLVVLEKPDTYSQRPSLYLYNIELDTLAYGYPLYGVEATALAMNKGASSFFIGCSDGSVVRWQIADTVQRPPLTARFSVADTVVPLLDSVRFENGTFPLSPGTTFEWDFGDGQTANDIYPTHVYKTPGSYTVRLHVRNEKGEDVTVVKEQYIAVPAISEDIVWIDKKNDGRIQSMVYSPDGKVLVTTIGNHQLVAYQSETGETVATYTIPRGKACSIAFSPDGQTLYCTTYEHSRRPLDYRPEIMLSFIDWFMYAVSVSTGTVQHLYQQSANSIINDWITDDIYEISAKTAVSPNGKTVFWCLGWNSEFSNFGRLLSFDTDSQTITGYNLYSHDNPDYPSHVLSTLVFSPDGQRLLTATDNGSSVMVRDPVTAKELHRFADSSVCARFLGDGNRIITNTSIWNSSRQQEKRLSLTDIPFFEILQNDKFLAAPRARKDSAMMIYDVVTDSPAYTYGAFPSVISVLAVDPSGKYLATGGGNGHIAVWHVPELSTTSVGMTGARAQTSVTLAPNPTTDALVVSIPMPEVGSIRVTLLDSFGQVVAEQSSVDGNSNFHFSVANVASGVYLCRVETPSGVVVRTVVVCH